MLTLGSHIKGRVLSNFAIQLVDFGYIIWWQTKEAEGFTNLLTC